MKSKILKNPSLLALALVATALSSQLASAAFTYTTQSNPSYVGGAIEDFAVTGPGGAAGITVGFSSTLSGSVMTAVPNGTGMDAKLLFSPTVAIPANTPFTFCLTTYSDIIGGPDSGGGERFSAEIRS